MLRSLVAFAALANGRLRRLALRRKLKDACWRRSHAHCRRWWWRRMAPWYPLEFGNYYPDPDMPPAHKPNPNLKQRPPRALSCLKLDNSRCYARHSCGNSYNVVVKLVQESNFLCILFPYYGNSSPGTTVSYGSEQLQASACVKKLKAQRPTYN